MTTEPVTAAIAYLTKDPRHRSEKPYYLYLNYDFDIASTNTKNDYRSILIHNARNLDANPLQMFSDYGFTRLDLNCSLKPEQYVDPNEVKLRLYPLFIQTVQSLFPDAVRIEVLEHGVRQRDPQWQIDGRERHDFNTSQPSDYVHIDMTASSAAKCSIKRFGIHPSEYRRFVVVNCWKPIRGPLYDFPLTLCDRRTVDHSVQTTAMDVVTANYVNENLRVYYDEAHQWYYWHGLEENEVVVFMQADSMAEGRAGVPHTAFSDPRVSRAVQLRESIEARVFVFFE